MTTPKPLSEWAPEAVADLGAFCARLVRFDPGMLIRLRPLGPGVLELWARLPFQVLVTRRVVLDLDEDVTVRAAELLSRLEEPQFELPARRDTEWRSPLPPAVGRRLDEVPSGEFRRLAEAAAHTLRSMVGRGVGERRLRDELLDHVALVVTEGDERAEVPVRLVQGVVRMGFLSRDDAAPVGIQRAATWVGAEATYGSAWYRAGSSLDLSPVR